MSQIIDNYHDAQQNILETFVDPRFLTSRSLLVTTKQTALRNRLLPVRLTTGRSTASGAR